MASTRSPTPRVSIDSARPPTLTKIGSPGGRARAATEPRVRFARGTSSNDSCEPSIVVEESAFEAAKTAQYDAVDAAYETVEISRDVDPQPMSASRETHVARAPLQ